MKDPAQTCSRTIAVGDVHGCAVELARLLASLELQPSDHLVMLGDVVDRGPDSRGALELLMQVSENCQLTCLLGNHEQMMLEAVDGKIPLQDWLIHGGAETLDSYGEGAAPQSIDPRHLEFIGGWGDYCVSETHFFVHGSYEEKLPWDQQPWESLRWQPYTWSAPGPHCSGKIAVVGHTANKQGRIANLGHMVCIDTFCHGGGWLTALDVGSGKVWQTSRAGASREGVLPAVIKSWLF